VDTKQDQAINRLLKKLSALRATLKGDELVLLDKIIITATAEEVSAHAMNVKATSTAANTVHSTAANTAADEVAAHAMNVKATSTAANTVHSTAANTAADEVAAHAMNVKATSTAANTVHSTAANTAADEVAAHALNIKIIYDSSKHEYVHIS